MKLRTEFLYAIALVISVALARCSGSRKTMYSLPTDMLPHVRKAYEAQCDRGIALYRLNCAGCHTSRIGRKDVLPDFTPEQLSGYALRVANDRHASEMTDSVISEDELAAIMTFLTYKRKNRQTR